MPVRIVVPPLRKKDRGVRPLPPDTVYVGPGTQWVNPYTAADAELCAALYRDWIERNYDSRRASWVRANLKALRGKNLASETPADQPSYVDVLLEVANSNPLENDHA